ncbi:PREDICTED: leukocyte immunoglobulin-like receptor subfamily B member 4 [Galeopterus variegatus]|uniref:Leukocyte immunoglobulin-like receptor subfamily B member 4 n=1 Tax=Galeopterus variegatus TaxID=482537 RepID=A0ABM0RUL2_GALVR|nr:PREDICTED: leukocyte immunoglobulin-like receptor subfamily B member 4 [Galeopterus variegatus]
MPDRAGLYHCSYQRGGRWSEHSDPLQLMMTGAYDKPSLSSIPGTDGASRDKVRLQCFSKVPFNTYILTKEDGSHIIKNQSSTPQDKVHRAVFLVDHVSSTQAGTYRCFGVMSNNPYVWSHPSDPLELEVNEVPGHPMESSPSIAPPDNQSLQKDILIGIPVATVLILTLVLLFFIFHHCKAKNSVDRKERQPEAGPMDGQAYEALVPKEVTYSELTCSALTQGTAMTPSSLPSHTQTSEYATLALR